ncbi:hypothetical protein GCK32_022308 [Trichostrongylus colubriformis]|uniref:Uncharacterized protein n=1 Tax=Trichostrongylus colubriformis TaxID=6319 RepID=A0AAN8G757_TRICO
MMIIVELGYRTELCCRVWSRGTNAISFHVIPGFSALRACSGDETSRRFDPFCALTRYFVLLLVLRSSSFKKILACLPYPRCYFSYFRQGSAQITYCLDFLPFLKRIMCV